MSPPSSKTPVVLPATLLALLQYPASSPGPQSPGSDPAVDRNGRETRKAETQDTEAGEDRERERERIQRRTDRKAKTGREMEKEKTVMYKKREDGGKR